MKKKVKNLLGMSILVLGMFFLLQIHVLGDSSNYLIETNQKNEVSQINKIANDNLEFKTKGTIIGSTKGEYLFVRKLNLSSTELMMTFDEWMASEHQRDLMRLTRIKRELEIGTELEIKYGMSTFSIPPVVPVKKFHIIN